MGQGDVVSAAAAIADLESVLPGFERRPFGQIGEGARDVADARIVDDGERIADLGATVGHHRQRRVGEGEFGLSRQAVMGVTALPVRLDVHMEGSRLAPGLADGRRRFYFERSVDGAGTAELGAVLELDPAFDRSVAAQGGAVGNPERVRIGEGAGDVKGTARDEGADLVRVHQAVIGTVAGQGQGAAAGLHDTVRQLDLAGIGRVDALVDGQIAGGQDDRARPFQSADRLVGFDRQVTCGGGVDGGLGKGAVRAAGIQIHIAVGQVQRAGEVVVGMENVCRARSRLRQRVAFARIRNVALQVDLVIQFEGSAVLPDRDVRGDIAGARYSEGPFVEAERSASQSAGRGDRERPAIADLNTAGERVVAGEGNGSVPHDRNAALSLDIGGDRDRQEVDLFLTPGEKRAGRDGYPAAGPVFDGQRFVFGEDMSGRPCDRYSLFEIDRPGDTAVETDGVTIARGFGRPEIREASGGTVAAGGGYVVIRRKMGAIVGQIVSRDKHPIAKRNTGGSRGHIGAAI